MARQPGYFSAKGQYRECIQFAGICVVNRKSFFCGAAGGSLFGLQESNPVSPEVAYQGSSEKFGTEKAPLIGHTEIDGSKGICFWQELREIL